MSRIFLIVLLLLTFDSFAQKDITKRISVRTNLLNLYMKGPSVSAEKLMSKRFAAEVSYMQGSNVKFLLTENYRYSGILLRMKTFIGKPIDYNIPKFYVGIYGGTLKRSFYNHGADGYFGWPDRTFSANSFRTGASLGVCYIGRSGFTLDCQHSFGYGKYTRIYKGSMASGYADVQIWMSVGYSF